MVFERSEKQRTNLSPAVSTVMSSSIPSRLHQLLQLLADHLIGLSLHLDQTKRDQSSTYWTLSYLSLFAVPGGEEGVAGTEVPLPPHDDDEVLTALVPG